MFIDIVFACLMVMAVFKGISKGFIVAVFSFFAFFIGLAAALKLSAVVADWLKRSSHIGEKWLPFISFLLVMIIVVILVRLGARLIEKSLGLLMLGWANKLAGIILYAVLYTMIFSVILFYAVQLHIIRETTVAASVTYPFIAPWAPKAIELFGKIVPVFKDVFSQLEQFFGHVAEKHSSVPVK
ncbi:MAG: CvpA family protein [Chitinophagaceae bacterium]|nr:CvpA family protein [Chitinophagaceae bacterium]